MDILQVASVEVRVRSFGGELIKRKLTSSSETLSTQCIHKSVPNSQRKTKRHSIDVREEQCVGGGLAPHSHVIVPDEALPACADNIIPTVVSQLYGLIDPTATIAQICCLRIPEVCPEAESIRVVQKAAV